MAKYKYVNGELIQLSTEEENAIIAKEKAWNDGALDRALFNLRDRRNNLLSETDWWGASDNTITDAQKKYRQDLRDLTAGLDTVDKVNAVVWPTKP